jgi:N6-L-threonylcarbamoyladenine synthase
MRSHQQRMPHAIRKVLDTARLSMADIDGIAFTRGPGVPSAPRDFPLSFPFTDGSCYRDGRWAGCLLDRGQVPRRCAQQADRWCSPYGSPTLLRLQIYCSNCHWSREKQAHALTPLLTSPTAEVPQFPFLTLLVSGGHTLLLLAQTRTSFHMLATTTDESIGRSFDKVSRILGLEWSTSGPGAALEEFCTTAHADEGDPEHLTAANIPSMPRILPNELVFSYSGLHSIVERYVTRHGGAGNLSTGTKRALARAFQTAAVTQLEEKLLLGLKWCARKRIAVRHVVVSGGVASNMYLRNRSVELVRW